MNAHFPSKPFYWTVAVEGYSWIPEVPGSKHSSTKKALAGRKFCVAKREYPNRTYQPSEVQNLYRIFGNLKPSEEAVQQFANEYGLLGIGTAPKTQSATGDRLRIKFEACSIGAEDKTAKISKPVQYGEAFEDWIVAIQDMNRAITLMELCRPGGGAVQADFMEMYELFNRYSNFDFAIRLQMSLDSTSGLHCLSLNPQSLLGAMWLQFGCASAINQEKATDRTCAICGEIFPMKSGRGHSKQIYCSNKCKMRAYWKRKENQPSQAEPSKPVDNRRALSDVDFDPDN
ncbi:hypothetical protein KIH39_23260 [Telmatocola sphagniphila]|uniref:Uncharacterized protein n=1 Tax=Telmatocola sphagniphila TaxID=1123043 RepID=A0A8E6B722_9BACT|nr:hypothetical protein [Telmatocola sphagniphila]QVL31728.1 hypothetical protein KIH39_23260 [Telmatocola sphagniphila]